VEYFTRLRKFWFQDRYALIWLLFAIPIMISFQSLVHEGTHGLVALIKTGSLPQVEPFLMIYDGRFQNGITNPDALSSETRRERVDCDEKVPPITHTRLAGWIGRPQIVALFLVVGFTLTFLFVRITNPVFGFLWRAWFLAACVDLMANIGLILFGTCKPSQDWARVMIRGDINSTLFWFLTFLLSLVVFSHFVWVWWSKWGTRPLLERGFWGYRWVALVLGVLSTISLLFYAVVRDSDIEYGSFPYIFGLILQIVGFLIYWIYFGLSFKHSEE
jgi:hypothetical protein